MSLTKTSRNQYTTIDPFDWSPPCTLEIKFSRALLYILMGGDEYGSTRSIRIY